MLPLHLALRPRAVIPPRPRRLPALAATFRS